LLDPFVRFQVQTAFERLGVVAFKAILRQKRPDVFGVARRRLGGGVGQTEEKGGENSVFHANTLSDRGVPLLPSEIRYLLKRNSRPVSTAQNRSSRISRRVVRGSRAA